MLPRTIPAVPSFFRFLFAGLVYIFARVPEKTLGNFVLNMIYITISIN
ncbi:hypothetical protein CLOLEP_00116 [[Clostridium] leptum DSM 753]|uniref:Uncharacterized protein n=1 Tax=[Clostridium] leptum DSM 753 TaxID=428125 RepID=A7VNJ1_9FIRM|nr:hypothetical protein CLOLEP_00116 [[Clostridium] leptum DSM 753]